jgi:hypothetical protein
MAEILYVDEIKEHIRECKRTGKRYNWLGFVENRFLSVLAEQLFTVGNGYDWVNGNEKLHKLEEETV